MDGYLDGSNGAFGSSLTNSDGMIQFAGPPGLAAINGTIPISDFMALASGTAVRLPGPGQNSAEVLLNDPRKALDRIMAESGMSDTISDQHSLGDLSRTYESSRGGPGTVSSGYGDKGGVSYGLYQFASALGTPEEFLAVEGKPWTKDFRGLKSGSAAFSKAWKAVAARDPAAFGEAQHAFIKRRDYDYQVQKLGKLGIDPAQMSAAFRDVVWSTAVQHGKGTNIVTDAIRAADKMFARTDPKYQEFVINKVYDRRTAIFRGLATNKSNPLSVRQNAWNNVNNRFPSERAAALTLLRRYH